MTGSPPISPTLNPNPVVFADERLMRQHEPVQPFGGGDFFTLRYPRCARLAPDWYGKTMLA